jgi:Cdc6-like AAA superfamily ATPase
VTVNPYHGVGQVADADRFVGRRELLRLLQDCWRGGRPANLSLQGNHRMGKTSLVRRAHELYAADQPDLLVVYLSVAGYEAGADVFRAIASRVQREVKRIEAPSGGTGPDWRSELADIELSIHGCEGWLDLKECLEAFFGTLRRAGIRVAVILDEFDQAEAFRTVEFQFLRDLVSENFSVGLIALSRRSIKSIEMAAVAHSTLDGVMGMRRPVGPFDDAEVDEMLARGLAAGVELDKLRDEIVARAGHHPYLVELFCHELVETHRAGGLDLAAAWEQVEPQFHDQFGRSITNLNADTGGHGADVLYQVLTGTHLTVEPQHVALLRRLGLVRLEGATLHLQSLELARYVRRAALAGTIHGWWLDRDLALRRRVRERLTRAWGAGWGERLGSRPGGRGWHGAWDGDPLVPADRLDPLDQLDTAEVIELVLTHWPLFEPHLGGEPFDWQERAEIVTSAREAAEHGRPLDAELRRRAELMLSGLPSA